MTTINATEFAISSGGAITHVSGSAIYSVLDLHAWLQDLADNPAPLSDDLISILGANPSELAGKRDALKPMALSLLPTVTIDDTVAQFVKFGSVSQGSGGSAALYAGVKTIGAVVAASPIYIIQNNVKITRFWGSASGHIQLLIKAKTAGALIAGNTNPTVPAGSVSIFSRKYGQTFSHFDVDLSIGGEATAALSTVLDGSLNSISEATAAAYWTGTPLITIAVADTTQDLGGGAGAKLHKGTITLQNGCTLQQAYAALMQAVSESSVQSVGSIAGYKFRALNSAYAENLSNPFGTFVGGKFFFAQGWWVTGVLSGELQNYQLISHDGTVEIPPNTVGISIGGVVSGDYVLCARDDGAGDILDTEYTVSASAAATSIVVTSLKSDTPSAGVIRIDGDRYTYSGKSGTTLSGLSPVIKAGGYTSAPAFVPYIDDVASSTTISSPTFLFDVNTTFRYRVRNGGGSPIVPFESTLSLTATGGTGTAVRNADA